MKIFRWVWLALTLGLLGYGFYQGMYVAPTEATMGDIQRIFYYHFPSAMMAFLFFFVSFVASIVYLASRRNHPQRALAADAAALAGAEMGIVFCTLVLIQGPLWARPVWASGGPGMRALPPPWCSGSSTPVIYCCASL